MLTLLGQCKWSDLQNAGTALDAAGGYNCARTAIGVDVQPGKYKRRTLKTAGSPV